MESLSWSETDTKFMRRALDLAAHAASLGEVPVGAVVVVQDTIIAEAFNRREMDRNPIAHAEMLALQDAARTLGRWRLSDATLYVTLEPCAMCAGSLVNARVRRLVYGAEDPKAGAVNSLYSIPSDPRLNHRVEVERGLLADAASELLKNFFRKRRR